ncbi:MULTISPECIES: hypothetical protein [Pseudoalteromonas]|uniref:Uncharacterized protein n=1 Tax=Pseudoalteromonas rubra TaxID=43658 RepID=A0A5S3V556_9GAMM|nr:MULTISPECIES: hypothetical protein [Pseudoalteromonas]MCG7563085.1 hypothetical protein [Pseudoalteromonas sp. McH1-42]QPB83483.1 hypothetical protein CWC22_010985 [Pseudoalteromonas rubra]
MEQLKIALALMGFFTGTCLILGVLTGHFHWACLLVGGFLYFISYVLWPSKKRGKRETESATMDFLEEIIEFPIDVISWFLRGLGRLFRYLLSTKGNGGDIDF